MTMTKICNPARKTKKHDKRQETEEQEVTALWFRIQTGSVPVFQQLCIFVNIKLNKEQKTRLTENKFPVFTCFYFCTVFLKNS